MALLDSYTAETIFSDYVKIRRNEKNIDIYINDEKKNLECETKNYGWLITDPNCRKGIIKLLRYFLSQKMISSKLVGYHTHFLYFLMHIIKIYKVNYYFDYIKNLVTTYAKNIEDIEMIAKNYSACGTIKKNKLLEYFLPKSKIPLYYLDFLIQSCSGNNTQLRTYYYRKIPFEKFDDYYIDPSHKYLKYCDIWYDDGLSEICFGGNIKQIEWFIKKVIYLHYHQNKSLKILMMKAVSFGRVKIVKWLIKKNIFTMCRQMEDILYTINDQYKVCAEKINRNSKKSINIDKTKIVKNRIAKIIITYFIENIEIKSIKFMSNVIRYLYGFPENMRLLKRLILFEQRILSNNKYTSIPKYIIINLFWDRPDGSKYDSKIYNVIFKMFVKYGIFKVNCNGKIINTTIKNYQQLINDYLLVAYGKFDKLLTVKAIKFGANAYPHIKIRTHGYAKFKKEYEFNLWFQKYMYKKEGIKL
jgi:hypothetical protein